MVWRSVEGSVEVAVVHRPRYDDWSLPKGRIEPGEPLVAGARREATEETGYEAALGRWLGRTAHRVEGGEEKVVDYWSARCGTEVGRTGGEVDAVAWLAPAAAAERLTWDADRGVLARFALRPVATATVLLVRHARAGSREAWSGPDDERPLDASGRAQVAYLAAALPAFWLPSERPYVVSAPPRRCVDTVAWAGTVAIEPCLGEDAAPADAVAYVRSLASYGVAVACSQGVVIPAIVAALRAADGLPAGDVRDAKGSAWVLSFSAGRLVAADYLDAA
ncbi:MAG: 8-oxo-(d)GTP phosphatase [Frankiaceae bacterium]|nr:8-oxo-(d)GTP phosphatase [Frankiaceae bacterium]